MAKLTFNRSAINAIAKQAKSSGATHLYLVGDHGVYFMNPAQKPPRRCAYALGCNPRVDRNWYDTKRDTFGGDDGVEDFKLASIESWLSKNTHSRTISLLITEDTVRLLTPIIKRAL